MILKTFFMYYCQYWCLLYSSTFSSISFTSFFFFFFFTGLFEFLIYYGYELFVNFIYANSHFQFTLLHAYTYDFHNQYNFLTLVNYSPLWLVLLQLDLEIFISLLALIYSPTLSPKSYL